MKGFPNAVADVEKLGLGLRCVSDLLAKGKNPKDDGVLGEALVRAKITGPRDKRVTVQEYIRTQRLKTHDRQSMRATARLLREFYRLLGFIQEKGNKIILSKDGQQIAAFKGRFLSTAEKAIWTTALVGMEHYGGEVKSSHPYRVLLNLVGKKPGISRAKCALALEAKDDSKTELDRIIKLSDFSEQEIRAKISVSKSNWDNAKKILPSLAEQLGDVLKRGDSLFPAASLLGGGKSPTRIAKKTGATRSSRRVTASSIARAATSEDFDEVPLPSTSDPKAVAAAIKLRRVRLRRHNLLVQDFARRLTPLLLDEDPFDILAHDKTQAILVEAKTLDSSAADERDRVREALSQLLYYENFNLAPSLRKIRLHKIALFEGRISSRLGEWLNSFGIGVVWKERDDFLGDGLARSLVGRYLD
jgi:hypothetical protein